MCLSVRFAAESFRDGPEVQDIEAGPYASPGPRGGIGGGSADGKERRRLGGRSSSSSGRGSGSHRDRERSHTRSASERRSKSKAGGLQSESYRRGGAEMRWSEMKALAEDIVSLPANKLTNTATAGRPPAVYRCSSVQYLFQLC
jgi:hypothetical protein